MYLHLMPSFPCLNRECHRGKASCRLLLAIFIRFYDAWCYVILSINVGTAILREKEMHAGPINACPY